MTAASEPSKLPQTMLLAPVVIDGVKLIAGSGVLPARIMFLVGNPTSVECRDNAPFTSKECMFLRDRATAAGIDASQCYWTYAVKYATFGNKPPKPADISACRAMLEDEIAKVNPEIIVPTGKAAFMAAMGPGYKITAYQHSFVESARFPGRTLYPMPSPSYIRRNPQLEYQYGQGFKDLRDKMAGISVDLTVPFTVISSDDDFRKLLLDVSQQMPDFIVLDCEWEGDRATDPGAYIRTMQLNVGPKRNYVVKFYPESTAEQPVVADVAYPNCANIQNCMKLFNEFLVAMRPPLVGHGIRADGRRLSHYGVNIRNYVVYDTMLAEHLIDNDAAFDLTNITLKYTKYGRYDAELESWRKEHKGLTEHGFGAIPDAILFPYGAYDVEVPREVLNAQREKLGRYLEDRTGFGSLFSIVMQSDADIYEAEEEGLIIDPDRLQQLVAKYHDKRRTLEAGFLTMVMQRGFPDDFNHRSTPQVRALLFGRATVAPDGREAGGLGLTPILTTDKPTKRWEWVVSQPDKVRKHYTPSTDGNTLEILQASHPIVKQLLDIRRIDQVCKNFLREDATGGINGCIWPDGRLHPEYNQLLDTGRFGTRDPNTQNWSKQAEKDLALLFDKDERPPPLRSIGVPGEDSVFVEGDFKSAELFVLAGLSGDFVMMEALTTPGKDLHDLTAINSFGLIVLLEGKPIEEQWLLDLARSDEPTFKKVQQHLVYMDKKNRMMTRDEFKDTVRVSAKSINFGIPYGRGAAAIATQVRAETGLPVVVSEIKEGIDAWKKTYRLAWTFLESCQAAVLNPGYVEGAWGRRRYFPKVDDDGLVMAFQRQAANFPIQNTVADTMRIAMSRVIRERDRLRLRSRISNQIHDALLVRVPNDEVETMTGILQSKMGGIAIPLPSGGTLVLDVEIERFARWGEKIKK